MVPLFLSYYNDFPEGNWLKKIINWFYSLPLEVKIFIIAFLGLVLSLLFFRAAIFNGLVTNIWAINPIIFVAEGKSISPEWCFQIHTAVDVFSSVTTTPPSVEAVKRDFLAIHNRVFKWRRAVSNRHWVP